MGNKRVSILKEEDAEWSVFITYIFTIRCLPDPFIFCHWCPVQLGNQDRNSL